MVGSGANEQFSVLSFIFKQFTGYYLFEIIFLIQPECLLYINVFFIKVSFFVSSANFLVHSDITESLFVIIGSNSSLVYS